MPSITIAIVEKSIKLNEEIYMIPKQWLIGYMDGWMAGWLGWIGSCEYN